MSNKSIDAPNAKRVSGMEVTGTDIGADKRALDVFSAGSVSHFWDMANLLIKGTMPEVNFNRILKSVTSSTAMTLAFIYDGSVQYYMDVTGMYGSSENIQIRNTHNLGTEFDLSGLLLESGDNIILEGGI